MGKRLDYESYIGQTINELTIVGMNYEKREEDIRLGKTPRNYYNCICSCNKDKVIPMDANKIINNTVSHCKFCFRMKIRKDLTGKKIGRLTVVKLARDIMDKRKEEGKYGTIWYCRCACGNPNLIPVFKENLRDTNTTSCGCVHNEITRNINFKDLTGKKFGRLTVKKETRIDTNEGVVWECDCECGGKAYVQTGNLSNGHTLSCGCVRIETINNMYVEKALNGNSIAHHIENIYGENTLYDYWLIEENEILNLNPYEVNKYSDYKAWFRCFNENDDHYKYLMTIKEFTKGHRCNICSMSSGELEITNYLELHNINFTPQKSYCDLIGLRGGLLRYDFYIHELNTFIEFHGKQHDMFVPHMHKTRDNYLRQVKHDELKLEYAKTNSINMITIWYYEQSKIKEILDDIFGRGESLVS